MKIFLVRVRLMFISKGYLLLYRLYFQLLGEKINCHETYYYCQQIYI
jgi:hypothetical protein